MKLYPPDAELILYETGFGADDPFDRLGTSKSLSNLVERIEDPLVIALDGGWGSGKTWFLKRWIAAHRLENDGRATTVYFDAFAHDFMDDPLIALTGVIGDQLPKKAEAKIWKRVKAAAAKLAKPAGRIGLAVASGGVTEVAGPLIDAAAEAASKEIQTAAEAFWAREDGRRAAMEQLRAALIDLTMIEIDGSAGPVPLVVVVDELDRCRPDYALALLEVVKHFFSVPNVHFVLGVNLEALAHSVRARYGSGIDAERYLRRFVSLSVHLPDEIGEYNAKPLALSYFTQMAPQMGIERNAVDKFSTHLEMVAKTNQLTMRDVNQLLSQLALIDPEVFTKYYWGYREIVISMILFRFTSSGLANKALSDTLSLKEVHDFYDIEPKMLEREDGGYNHQAYLISGLWEHIISRGTGPEKDQKEFARAFSQFGDGNPRKVLRVANGVISKFAFPSAEG
ncbi:P-loop NTPase fold protein [Paracoccus sp. R86501]|uniref:KAP family P-loop NTPase fold protein n=1 Tax=Paracoccus sp. R86501 TaxID=3101711 RepID=UPI00366A979E